MSLVSFGSDNHAGIHPLLLEEMQNVNEGFAPAYEQDDWSQNLRTKLCEEFDAVDAALVFNGTAANVICLQLATQSYHSVLCAENSHMVVDECGAPEKIAGVKLINLPTIHGKIEIDKIEDFILRKGDQHFSQAKVISVTQPTEYGTLYSLAEMKEISELCKKHDLYLHIDGARLPNAAVALNGSFKELTALADLISFGGAKNGLMMGEFVIVRNPNLKEGLKFFRKQSLQLPSKTRFLTAPFLKYMENSLWKEIASHENQMAKLLRTQLEGIKGLKITRPTEANAVFCTLPKEVIKPLRKKFFFYVWDEKSFEVRLMTSFSITSQHIEEFVNELKTQLKEQSL